MAHQSLYRTYRPQTFSDVVGQEHIERTLKNAVAGGTVAHAYLFCGPRGTGKTTTARILAKALDCEKGPTGEPDGTCEECIEIAEGRHPDVYELDAASRTGVDNVREEIIGRVNFAPTRGRYKVYIIDEVHMLSTAAFNALLKTLEEPPSHVVFVLATTHPHKVPETIQSRCQRFDFRRISVDDIAGRLRVISDGEGFEVPDAALTLMARHAAGGMRDAITTLEQLASFTGGRIGLDDVEGLLGEVETTVLFEIAGLVARRDIAGCFRWVARFAEQGTDLAEFVREFTGHVRDLYVIAAVGDGQGIVDAGAEEIAQLTAQAAEFGGPDRLSRMLDLLGELAAEMRWSSDQRLSLEVALTRMARPHGDITLEALAERLEAIERGGAAALRGPSALTPGATAQALAAPATSAAAAESAARDLREATPSARRIETIPAQAPTPPAFGRPETPDGSEVEEPAAPEPIVVEAHHAGGLDRSAARRAWPAVLAEIKKAKPGRAQLFGVAEVEVDPDGETLVVEFPSDQAFSVQLAEEPDMRDLLQRSLAGVLGFAPPVRLQLGRGAVRRAEVPPAAGAADPGDPRGSNASSPRAAAADPPPAATDHDPPPAAVADDTPAGDPPKARLGAAPATRPAPTAEPAPRAESRPPGHPTDLERFLTEGLGAQILDERPARPAASAPGVAEDDEAAAEFVSAAPTFYDDPGFMDEDPREDKLT